MKKIFKFLGLFCLSVAVAIGSFFITKQETKTLTASASTSFPDSTGGGEFDVSYSNLAFKGSNIYVPVMRNDASSLYDYLLIKISFDTDSLAGVFRYSFTGSTGFFVQNEYNSNNVKFNYSLINFVKATSDSNFTSVNYSDIFGASSVYSSNVYYGVYAANFSSPLLITGSQQALSSDIISCQVGSSDLTGFSGHYNFIRYTDTNGNFVTFYFKCNDTNLLLENRLYFFDLNLTDSQQYNQGYQQGLADNQQNIYNNGFNAGKIIGYNNGKTDGIASANNYSFVGLIGAVFDAPLQTFKGLLNFNVLGINLLDFAMALITIALVAYIIRLIKGGR